MALSLHTRVNHDTAPTGVDSEIVFLAGLEAVEVEKEKARAPIDLVIVLDRSGSMAGEKLGLCKQTLKFLAEAALNETDFLALITFDSNIVVDFSGGKMTEDNKKLFLSKVDTITANSNTNLSGGLFKGLELLQISGTADVSAVCILTDGQMNEGVTDKAKLVEMTKKIIDSFPEKKAKPSVFTFGYGTDADSLTMSNLAEATGGSFYPITNTEAVPVSFADCLGGLTSVAAQNIEVVVELSGGGAEFLGNPMTSTFGFEKLSACAFKMKLKDMYAGEHRDLLFKIRMPAFETASPTVAKATIRYMDVLNERSATTSSEVHVARVKGNELPTSPPDVEVMRHVVRIEAAQAMEEAKRMAMRGNLQGGQMLMQQMKTRKDVAMAQMGIDDDADEMMNELESDIQEATKGMRSHSIFQREGLGKMSAMSVSHAQQRSNKSESAAPSTYANVKKKSMMDAAKNAFGLS